MDMTAELQRYVELTGWIRELSSPRREEVESAEEYRAILLRNFSRIGELARINGEILKTCIYPLLKEDQLLTKEQIAALRAFYGMLMDAYRLHNLDEPLLYKVAKRLLEDAEKKDDTAHLIRALDDFMTATYTIMEMSDRLCPSDESFFRYRAEGLAAAKRLLRWLDKDLFATLPDEETKKIILVTSRYAISMYQHPSGQVDRAIAEEGFRVLERALSLLDDPFYREQVPSYDWQYHEYRTLEYFSNMTERLNELKLKPEQLEKIYLYTERLYAFRSDFPMEFSDICSEELLLLNRFRNSYLADEMTLSSYQESLIALSEKNRPDDYSFAANLLHILVPLEYLLTIDPARMTARQEQRVTQYYKELIAYVHRMPKTENFTYMAGDITRVLEHFIEVPGGVDFQSLSLGLMASIHPPTYVHSLSVADISVCIAKHLYETDPALFAGVPGYPDRDVMRANIWNAAVCHDIGKLFIVDTIITYGRDLFEDEFHWIKAHPVIAHRLLSRYTETAPYANVALLHHKYYDDSAGYPEEAKVAEAPDKVLVAIVACADCLDAATDDVGRSYKSGKTLDDFVREIDAEGGGRFAPYLVELLHKEEVCEDLKGILENGRESNYHKTYQLLERMLK